MCRAGNAERPHPGPPVSAKRATDGDRAEWVARGARVGVNMAESQQQEEARKRQKIQQQLDQALADSFPASDPVSIVTSNEEEDWGVEPLPGAGADEKAR